jgi:hypothetical protein
MVDIPDVVIIHVYIEIILQALPDAVTVGFFIVFHVMGYYR